MSQGGWGWCQKTLRQCPEMCFQLKIIAKFLTALFNSRYYEILDLKFKCCLNLDDLALHQGCVIWDLGCWCYLQHQYFHNQHLCNFLIESPTDLVSCICKMTVSHASHSYIFFIFLKQIYYAKVFHRILMILHFPREIIKDINNCWCSVFWIWLFSK